MYGAVLEGVGEWEPGQYHICMCYIHIQNSTRSIAPNTSVHLSAFHSPPHLQEPPSIQSPGVRQQISTSLPVGPFLMLINSTFPEKSFSASPHTHCSFSTTFFLQFSREGPSGTQFLQQK